MSLERVTYNEMVMGDVEAFSSVYLLHIALGQMLEKNDIPKLVGEVNVSIKPADFFEDVLIVSLQGYTEKEES
jgi:hypothetical protein